MTRTNRTRLLLTAFLWPVACEYQIPDFQRQLPNGYVLVDTSRGVVSITDARCMVLLGPTVDLLGIDGDVVVGHFTPLSDRPHTGTPGFFILDTRTGQLQQGLGKAEWEPKARIAAARAEKPLRRPDDRNDDLCR